MGVWETVDEDSIEIILQVVIGSRKHCLNILSQLRLHFSSVKVHRTTMEDTLQTILGSTIVEKRWTPRT
jgi:hypothetical protein